MSFNLKTTAVFLEQVRELSHEARLLIDKKLDLVKENPYHFKSLHSKRFKLFRVRLSLDGVESRLVYAVIEPDVVVVCILYRKHDYNDLEKYLGKADLA